MNVYCFIYEYGKENMQALYKFFSMTFGVMDITGMFARLPRRLITSMYCHIL